MKGSQHWVLSSVGCFAIFAGCVPAKAQSFAYVPNGTTVSVIDTGTNTVVDTVAGLGSPFGVALAPNGSFAYVTNFQNSWVSVIDRTNNQAATVPGFSGPFGIAVAPNGANAYVANLANDSVGIINTATNLLAGTVPLPSGSEPVGVAITPNSALVYVSDQGTNAVSVLSTATNAVIATVPVGANPAFLAITPNGAFVYVPNFGSTTVSVISTATNSVVATVPVGTKPVGVAIRPDGAIAYVTNRDDNTVSAISTATNTVINVVPVGNGPNGVAFTGDGAFAYVVNQFGGTVSVIETAGSTVVATIPIVAGAQTIAISPADNDSQFAQLSGSNTFNGNQTVNGVVSATSFVGDGSGLTGVVAASANIANLANYATSAGDATTLGGNPPGAFAPASGSPSYVAKAGDTMTGTLNLPANGLVAGGNQLSLFGGNVGIGTATPEGYPGYTSLHIDDARSGFGGAFLQLTHSASSNKARIVSDANGLLLCSGCGGGGAIAAPVRIKAGEITTGTDSHIFILPNGNVGVGTVTPVAKLDVNGTANFSGLVTFASGQTFPGAGNGTITGVTPGAGLSGGGSTGNVTLNNTGILSLNASNGIATTGGQNPTLSLNTGFTDARYAQLGANTFTGTQTMPILSAGTISSTFGSFNANVNGAVVTATNGFIGNGIGIYGTGYTGVRGDTTGGYGVYGSAGGGGIGVFGFNNSGIGVYGWGKIAVTGYNNTPGGIGVRAVATDTGGTALTAENGSAGKIFIGIGPNHNQVFTLDGAGSISTNGNMSSAGSTTIGSGTPITKHISVLFSNVTFNARLSPGTCTVWPGTVSGAADGDSVSVGMSSSLMSANIVYSAWAINGGVQLRICNPTGAPTTVGAGNIRVDVWKH